MCWAVLTLWGGLCPPNSLLPAEKHLSGSHTSLPLALGVNSLQPLTQPPSLLLPGTSALHWTPHYPACYLAFLGQGCKSALRLNSHSCHRTEGTESGAGSSTPDSTTLRKMHRTKQSRSLF